MAEYRLHGVAQSGNTYKPALMLNLCGADWEPVHVDLFRGAHRKPEFLALNPMGEIPTLEGPEGVTSQSGSMLHMLARRFGRFGGEGDRERDEILRWMFWDNHRLSHYTGVYRFMTHFLDPAKRDPGAIAFLNGRRAGAMQVFDAHLAKQPYVAVADRPTIADISCVGYMYFLEELGEGAEQWPNVVAWRERLKALPGWGHPYDLLPGHPFQPTW